MSWKKYTCCLLALGFLIVTGGGIKSRAAQRWPWEYPPNEHVGTEIHPTPPINISSDDTDKPDFDSSATVDNLPISGQ